MRQRESQIEFRARLTEVGVEQDRNGERLATGPASPLSFLRIDSHPLYGGSPIPEKLERRKLDLQEPYTPEARLPGI